MVLLNLGEIKEHLKELSGWELLGKSIRKKFKFANFMQAVEFLNKVASIAEEMQHHPDIHIQNYNEVVLQITTHDEGGITAKDFQLAHKVEELAA